MLTISVMDPRLGSLFLLQFGLQLILFIEVGPLNLVTQFADFFFVDLLELKNGLLYSNLEVPHQHLPGFASLLFLAGQQVHLRVSLMEQSMELNHACLDLEFLEGFA